MVKLEISADIVRVLNQSNCEKSVTLWQPYNSNCLLTGCEGRIRIYKPEVFHTAQNSLRLDVDHMTSQILPREWSSVSYFRLPLKSLNLAISGTREDIKKR